MISDINITNEWFDFNDISKFNICGIYQILCLVNTKRYIGSSINIRRRWITHIKDLKQNSHHSQYLQKAFNKYKINEFKFNILEITTIENLTKREQFWMDFYHSYSNDYGFNLCPNASSCLGSKQSQSTIDKRIQSRGTILTEAEVKEVKQLLSEGIKNKDIKKILNISNSNLLSIKYNKTWKHIKVNESKYIFGSCKGEECSRSKLKNTDIFNIIELFKFCTDKEISIIYNVTSGTINRIRCGKTWKHITVNYTPLLNKQKLKPNDIINIRELSKFLLQKEIAEMYNISSGSISEILSKKRFKNI